MTAYTHPHDIRMPRTQREANPALEYAVWNKAKPLRPLWHEAIAAVGLALFLIFCIVFLPMILEGK